MSASTRIDALARATARDLFRRPGLMLALAGAGLTTLLLPRLTSRALDDGGSLFVELLLTSAALYLCVLAGLCGVVVAAKESPLGPSLELSVTPATWLEGVAGRFAGVLAVLSLHLSLITLVAITVGALETATPSLLAVGLCGVLSQAIVLGATGVLLGSILPQQLAGAGVLLVLVLTRLVPPGSLDGIPGLLAAALPDPAALDLGREVGFQRPIAVHALALAALGGLLQASGYLLGAAGLQRWRATR